MASSVSVHADGFSPFPSILAYFPLLSDANLPPHWDIKQSLQTDCVTVLLNANTGKVLRLSAALLGSTCS